MHILETQVWNCCRANHLDPDDAIEAFTAVVDYDAPTDGRGVAGGVKAKGYG